ncbi:MAG: hypothetical protein HKN26_03720 [Acidimicrobiales bacterium]|nr:hypothetical protein [Acidimicrobiales bacterium]
MVAEHRHLTHLAYIHRPASRDSPHITWHTTGPEPSPAQQALLERLEPHSPMPQTIACDGVDFHLAAIDGATAGIFCFGHAERELTPEEIADTAGLATTYFTVIDQFEAGPFGGPLPVVTAEAHDGGAHITVTRPGSDHVGHAWATDPARAAVEATLQAFNATVRRFDVESVHLPEGRAVLALLTFDDERIVPGITLATGRVAEVAVAATLRALHHAGLVDCS